MASDYFLWYVLHQFQCNLFWKYSPSSQDNHLINGSMTHMLAIHVDTLALWPVRFIPCCAWKFQFQRFWFSFLLWLIVTVLCFVLLLLNFECGIYPAAAGAFSCCDKKVELNVIVSELLELGLTWSPLSFFTI